MPVHTMPTHFPRRLDRWAGPLRRSALAVAVACLAAQLSGCVAFPPPSTSVQALSDAAPALPAVWGDPPARAVRDRHAAGAGWADPPNAVPLVAELAPVGPGAERQGEAGTSLLRSLLARLWPRWVESDAGSPSAATATAERSSSSEPAGVGDGALTAAQGPAALDVEPATARKGPASDAAAPAAAAAGSPAANRPRGLAAVKSLAWQGHAGPADTTPAIVAAPAPGASAQGPARVDRLASNAEPDPARASALRSAPAAVTLALAPAEAPPAAAGQGQPVTQPAEATAGAAARAEPPGAASAPAGVASAPPAQAEAGVASAAPAQGKAGVASAAPGAPAAPAPGGPSPASPPAGSAAGSLAPQPRLDMLPTLLGLPSVLPMHPAAPGRPVESVSDLAALTLHDAAVGTARQSPEVTAAELRLESFGQTRRAAAGALRPQVTVRTAGGRGITRSVDPTSVLYRLDAMASMRQALIDRPAGLEVQRQDLLTGSATEQLRDADSKALLDGGLAFLGVLQARVGLSLGEQYETRLAELARYIGERAAAGGTSQAEADRLRARVANVRSTLADTRAQLMSALRNLERLVGTVPPALSMVGVQAIDVPGADDEAVAAAFRGNAELAAARLEISAAGLERGIARARSAPKLEFELTHTRARNASGTPGQTNDTKGMLVLSMNAYDGGTSAAQAGAADARRRELEARATATERRLQFEIQSAYANLEASSQRFVSVREELDGNQRVVQAFQAQLVGNGRPLLDVLDAYQRHYQSQIDLTQVLVATAQSQWRLAHLMGSLSMQLGQPAAR
jgi:outer membrane protein TolC